MVSYLIVSKNLSTQEKINLKSRLNILICKQEYYDLFRKILVLIGLNLYWCKQK